MYNNIFDSHAHYTDKAFNDDRENLLGSLRESGICGIINCGADLKSSEEPNEVKLSPGGAIDHATYFNRYTKLFEKCLPREERNYGYYALLPGDKFIPEDLIKDEISKFEELGDLRPVDGNYSWNEIFKHCAAERFNVYKEQEQFAHLIALTGNGNYVCIDNMLDAINSGIIEMKYAPYHGAMAFQIKSIRPM